MRGILGLWRQFGNEARLHLNTLLSGHLVNLMSGAERRRRRREEKEKEKEGNWIEGERTRASATLGERGTEERGVVKEGVCGEHWLI